MELTQEHFDNGVKNILDKMVLKNDFNEALKNLATKDDIHRIEKDLDQVKLDMATKMATKEDLKELDTNLRTYIHEGIETVMIGMDAMTEKLDVTARVEALEKKH